MTRSAPSIGFITFVCANDGRDRPKAGRRTYYKREEKRVSLAEMRSHKEGWTYQKSTLLRFCAFARDELFATGQPISGVSVTQGCFLDGEAVLGVPSMACALFSGKSA